MAWGDMSFGEQAAVTGGVASGLGGILSGIVGGRKRRQEQRAAGKQLQQRTREYENFQFENAFAGMQNPYEDLKVGTQAADYQSQQMQQSAANTLDALRASGGGLGAASVAQALQGQMASSQQQISADIQQQELQNQAMAAQGQANINQMAAQGAMDVQGMELNRTETLLGMAQGRKKAADEARAAATQALVGGIGDIAGAAMSMGLSGGFSK